ncbi:HhH-GPD family protein [Planctomonas psychrotolerans]|uniref:A/G-specific adenine glycosylase n=1 Tax=Planctomonas psychrotolerans TaxID=2528712 RepID=UPI001D0D20A3|nr:A/G-specific adenine glycosylase [Planctomonas psychrotolerans]
MPDTPPFADAIVGWFRDSARDLPWRRPGFPAWGTLVSEFMLQQTPVARVIPRLEEWLARWPEPASLAAEPASEAVRAWGRLGYPRRALHLHACATAITERHGGRVPDDVPTLLALPGIGDYTARAIAVFAFGSRHPVVDTNVRRVLARAISGVADPGPPSTRRDLALMADQLPESDEDARVFNAGAMELGAVVCTARAPRCGACPVRELCAWRMRGYPAYDGPARTVQKRFVGSDRQVRGLLLAELRAAQGPVAAERLTTVWAESTQRDRALAALLRDGLASEAAPGTYVLGAG